MGDNNNLLLSVIMSVYNGQDTLRQAIDSILNQTELNFEFLIINDASTDNTKDILHSYTDPRLRLLHNDINIGLTQSLNRGLKEANGRFIARMDVDDISLPGRLISQVRALQSKHADICFCGCQFVDEDTGKVWNWIPKVWPLIYWRGLFENSFGVHSSVMFRKHAINQIGGYDPSFIYAQDYELWSQCVTKGLRFTYIQDVFLQYHWRTTGISKRKLEEQKYFASIVSNRALNNLLVGASDENLKFLGWLFTSRTETELSNISTYLPSAISLIKKCCKLLKEKEDYGLIWQDAAKSMTYRLPSILSYQEKCILLFMITKCIINSESIFQTLFLCSKVYYYARKKSRLNLIRTNGH